jgi:hypothetical protein
LYTLLALTLHVSRGVMEKSPCFKVACGLGSIACIAAAAVLISPTKAFAQTACSNYSGPLCTTVKYCNAWGGPSGQCSSWVTEYNYYSKVKT